MGLLSTVWRQLASVFECVYASEDYAAVWCGMRSREICGAFFSADFCLVLRQLFVKMGPALRVPLTFVVSRDPTRRDGRGAMGADDVSNPLAPDYANPVPEKPTPKSNADFRKVSVDSRDGSQFPATA
jgi:hypothetical protein